jgi:glycine cleavage system aminomethyltransferase T
MAHRAMAHQHAMLCTLTLEANVDAKGVKRYPVGTVPILDPATGETLVDALGRRSFSTSMAYGPTIGKTIMLAYLPHEKAVKGSRFEIEYFGDLYPVEVAGVGYEPLYDPESLKPRS